ncbi:uncharacterized protein LOC141864186 [Acropora palmata]|uniref:uncharacterized protein LOC141864186 n=1 Tax=Acropora palmata TaxID=6131 RepID=UPI003D9FB5CB
MNVLIIFSVCVTAALACDRPLPKLAACNLPAGDCSCQAGLDCSLTKKLIYGGQVFPVKQCMPIGVDIDIETVDMDNPSGGVAGASLFYPLKKCTTDTDCWDNFCCVFGKRCMPKILEYFSCFFLDKHKCGCANGLQCKVTATITLPIIHHKLKIKQCACSNLPKYSPCDTQSSFFFILFNQRDVNAQRIFRFVFKENPDYKCSRGLACKVTREMFLDGHNVQVKQCMPVDERVVVEQLTEDDVRETLDPGSTAVEQTSRFYPGKKCTTAADCFWPNTCCLLNKRCSLKLLKYFTCYFQSFHKCGCMDGLVCKTTTQVTLPIIKVPFPIRQCVPKDDVDN